MPKIHEVFGFPLEDKSPVAEDHRKRTWCPFRNDYCDGGGNRYLSRAEFDEEKDHDLIEYFGGKKVVQAGVCSLKVGTAGNWIVCPRRLFAVPKLPNGSVTMENLRPHERAILELAKLPPGQYGVWKEVKIKYGELSGDEMKAFDYTLDYVFVPLRRSSLSEIEELAPKLAASNGAGLANAGYAVSGDGSVDGVPLGIPLVIEIMTSSTSGGNKAQGTTITQAFKAAIRGIEHTSPGINYRQVWARMVSQLIVKSEMAVNWGGKTMWVVQDLLTEYIKSTTALDLKKLVTDSLQEVNMVTSEYEDPDGSMLALKNLYAGTIDPDVLKTIKEKKPYFLEIIKAPALPPLAELQRVLLGSKPDSVLHIS